MNRAGWIILVGQGYPVRVSDEEWEVAWFADESAAQQWIDAHPKAKNPQPIELKEYTR